MADAKQGKKPEPASEESKAENKPSLPPEAKDRNEVVERATESGIYTKSDANKGKTGAGGTGDSGSTGTTGAKLGDGNMKTEASTGTSAAPQPKK